MDDENQFPDVRRSFMGGEPNGKIASPWGLAAALALIVAVGILCITVIIFG
jgi:hypothetical protein